MNASIRCCVNVWADGTSGYALAEVDLMSLAAAGAAVDAASDGVL